MRRRLDRLAAEINDGGSASFDTAARAVAIGGYFTEDVVIDLGRGTSPIEGRPLVIDMVARLRPRIRRFSVKFTDVAVRLTGLDEAVVELTAEIIPRDDIEDRLDAREFSAELIRWDGEWRIRRATAVQALR